MELIPFKDHLPQQIVGVFFFYYFFLQQKTIIFVPMKRITLFVALCTMLVLGACGSKSTTDEQTDETVVDSTSVVTTEEVVELDSIEAQ